MAGTLSPSRAADFQSCPLKYRLRVIDRLPEPPSPAAARGTLVHAVLEQLFEQPPAERTLARAVDALAVAWKILADEAPDLAAMLDAMTPADRGEWISSAVPLLETYFRMEDPRRLNPQARELRVEYQLPDGPLLRGIIDRIDQAPDGALRIVDYKTGKPPAPAFERRALFQMKFYALMVWRTRDVIPRQLLLLYLTGGQALTYRADRDELITFERTVRALNAAIARAVATGDWRPSPSKLCGWCSYQPICPAWGGTLPPLPERTPA